jgi:hypothetical protein
VVAIVCSSPPPNQCDSSEQACALSCAATKHPRTQQCCAHTCMAAT